MENAKKSRRAIRTIFKKTGNTILDLVTKTDIQHDEIDIKWNLMQEKHEKLKELDSKIYENLQNNETSESELVQEMENTDEYEALFQKVKAKVTKLLNDLSVDSPEVSILTNMQARKFKLPQLETIKFGGEIKDWLPFWTQFRKIHEDTLILPEDKFQYLQQATITGTRARQLVESFPLTRENYPKAIEALQTRFGRDELLVEVYIRELLKLVLQNTSAQEKQSLSTLYDKLETQLRALETLGVTTEKYEAMLFPLIESALPEELLRVWQRSSHFTQMQTESKGNRLINLMSFIKNEVDAEQRINLATEGFNLVGDRNKRSKKALDQQIPTAAGLINYDTKKCVFCEGNHSAEKCFKMQKMSLDERREVLSQKRGCFRCAKVGHQRKNCRERLKCLVCRRQHVVILCPELNADRAKSDETKRTDSVRKSENTEASLSSLVNPTVTTVFLQTLRVRLCNDRGSRIVRALFDSGSQRSYILNNTARELNYSVKRSQNMIHTLFGGAQTGEQKHNCYEVRVANLMNDYSCTFEVMDQSVICNNICDIHEGVWTRELKGHGIEVSDTKGNEPIELLIGADVSGKLFTGKRLILECGLVAVDTLLGWVLMGKTPNTSVYQDTTMVVTSLYNATRTMKDWWDLDILGIAEPTEETNKAKAYALAKETFQKTIMVNQEGRYEVRLPWREDHPPLPSNEYLAKKRLEKTLVKIQNNGYQEQYQEVFDEWCKEEIIERVVEEKEEGKHYLPHRPVIKESSASTKVRPVFDASARELNSPSLNDCLQKGENLIELIPEILFKFRLERYGVVADIRKAFLQISIHEDDRNYLRFFWKNREGEEIIFRHNRVVFGVNSSPFILAATIDYHLEQCLKKSVTSSIYSEKVIVKLRSSFYVDNCVTSVNNTEELVNFMEEATAALNEGKFELRGWEYTGDLNKEMTYVLGLMWNKSEDTLSIWYKDISLEAKEITKREILSAAQRIFDPIGFTSPVTLIPKQLLQELWVQKVGWDQEVPENIKIAFQKWIEELPSLKEVRIPRWFNMEANDNQKVTLHTFCDASSTAYAAAVFMRNETSDGVKIHLVSAKCRVTPIKKMSIPRLELLAATIGARLWYQVRIALKIEVTSYFWSDSTTVLSWIKRKEEWSVFVWNRIQEIRKLTDSEQWNHVPGEKNPADLLSRGCSPKALTSSKWWEGPRWLYEGKEGWPETKMEADEGEINIERKKKAVKTLLVIEEGVRLYSYFSKYIMNVRMIAWMRRFSYNCQNPNERKQGELTAEEVMEGEKNLIRIAQQEGLLPLKKEIENTLRVFQDEEGLLRVKSRLTNREDAKDFLFPYLMPAKHIITERLIHHNHVTACHAKGQGLLSILRERFWILGGRHTIRAVTNKCVKCKRHDEKQLKVETAPLPINRIRDASVFEVIGIDLAGPLYLKDKSKVWICLFTCAVYRAIHLEIVYSLSTHDFLNALRRFIARRGRPKYIYTDNGTNFRGAENLMNNLEWDTIQNETSAERICWRFSPPSAPWWGGWWERLIGSLKKLLKRTLGQACITGDELYTLLCDCEAVINSRPLTYISNSVNDLKTITPSMFLTEIKECGVPDLDNIDQISLNRRYKYLQRLRNELRERFRSEYLGQLVRSDRVKDSYDVTVGEIVLIGSENTKRVNWPLARVIELLPGKDKVVRLVRLQTAHGQLLRPVQKLYNLECVPRPLETGNRNEDTEVPRERDAHADYIDKIGKQSDVQAGKQSDVQAGEQSDAKAGEQSDAKAGEQHGNENSEVNSDVEKGNKVKGVVKDKSYMTKAGRQIQKPKRYM